MTHWDRTDLVVNVLVVLTVAGLCTAAWAFFSAVTP